MKQTIKWHEDALNNMKTYRTALNIEKEGLQRYLDRVEASIAERENQLNMAAERGLTEFDCEKFGKRKVK